MLDTTKMIEVTQLEDADLIYQFTEQLPHYKLKGFSWGHQVVVDPFPCYRHNYGLIWQTAQQLAKKFPLGMVVRYYVLAHEPISRTNATTYHDEDYDSALTIKPQMAEIIMNGKRVCIHPAMTKYLTVHEYGHAVYYWLSEVFGFDNKDPDGLYRKYCEVRHINFNESRRSVYGGRKWHLDIGEVFANDFRIVVGNESSEWWPHTNHTEPLTATGVVDWWIAAGEASQKYLAKKESPLTITVESSMSYAT